MEVKYINISLDDIEPDLKLFIFPEGKSKCFIIDYENASLNAESPFQILEGNSYEYNFNKDNYQLKNDVQGIIIPSKTNKTSGRIVPSIFVGTLTVEIINYNDYNSTNKNIKLEVLATKFNKDIDKSYRENYRFMLESITEKCTELLMQINTPVYQNFEINYNSNSNTIYQRFCFVKSIITSDLFDESFERILSNPNTNWLENIQERNSDSIKKINRQIIKQITKGSNRVKLSGDYSLSSKGINSIPQKMQFTKKVETKDTPENRFVKYVLESFKKFTEECLTVFLFYKLVKPVEEANFIKNKLEIILNNNFFKEIKQPVSLKLNSPVLHKRSGYREILNRWLQFDLASKLIWKGGDDVYEAGKKDIATLYEYWIFFTLYDLLKQKFEINEITHNEIKYKNLIIETKDGLSLMLKSGKHTALKGVFIKKNRDLNFKFSYNRTFKGGVEYNDKISGSWTSTLRPDYTLSIWPKSISENEAEKTEAIVHIHFDAKYKIDNFYQNLNISIDDEDLEVVLNNNKLDERKGSYKNIDLLKMHAYKDAIRRSGGAYILYPGNVDKRFRGFHEIIPGLGAFSVNPANLNTDITELSKFIDSVINHFLDRTSQREKLYNQTYKIFNVEKKDNDVLYERFPEYEDDEKIIPDDTSVIVGFYKSDEQLKWILDKKKYNFRIGLKTGSININSFIINARYLILHGKNELITSKIYKLKKNGPLIYSREDLIKNGYPNPSQEFYLIFSIEEDISKMFDGFKVDLNKIPNFKSYRNSSKPFSTSLSTILKSKPNI